MGRTITCSSRSLWASCGCTSSALRQNPYEPSVLPTSSLSPEAAGTLPSPVLSSFLYKLHNESSPEPHQKAYPFGLTPGFLRPLNEPNQIYLGRLHNSDFGNRYSELVISEFGIGSSPCPPGAPSKRLPDCHCPPGNCHRGIVSYGNLPSRHCPGGN